MLILLIFKKNPPTVGIEPTIPGLEGRCLIHWATWALSQQPESNQRPTDDQLTSTVCRSTN